MKTLITFLLACTCLTTKAQLIAVYPQNYEWVYSDATNEMTKEKTYYAELKNQMTADAPRPMGIVVRNSNKENEVFINIGNAIFDVHANGYSVDLKFDDGKIETVWTDQPREGTFKTIFLRNPNKIIKKMKAAKKMMLQAYIYNHGNEVYTFDIEGLKWEH